MFSKRKFKQLLEIQTPDKKEKRKNADLTSYRKILGNNFRPTQTKFPPNSLLPANTTAKRVMGHHKAS